MKKIVYTLLLCIFFCTTFQAQTTRYVKQTASGDGSSWANASNNLQAMINVSAEGDTVFVAAGTYSPIYTASGWNSSTNNYPTNGGVENNAFVLKAGVLVYGGFPASGNPNFTNRNWETNVTTLNGNNSCYHVVVATGDMGDAIFDGFTVTRGNANDNAGSYQVNNKTIYNYNGGGMYLVQCNLKFNNIKIKDNHANIRGGGLFCYNDVSQNSYPVGKNIEIINNQALQEGGGIYARSCLRLIRAAIKSNSAQRGGGINVEGASLSYILSPTIVNAIISGNVAKSMGTQNNQNNLPKVGGGVYSGARGMPNLVNVTVAGNYAAGISQTAGTNNGEGGGCYGYQAPVNGGGFSVTNSIIWGNKAQSGKPNVNAAGTYTRSLVEGEDDNYWQKMNMDPLFVGSYQASATPNTNGDYRVKQLSPAISAADTALYKNYAQMSGQNPWLDEKDMNNDPRLVYKDLDLGAFEMQDPIKPDSLGRIFVKPGGAGTRNGSSWANAYPNFADLLNYACYHNYLSTPNDSIKQIWVVQGTYIPEHAYGDGTDERDKSFVLPEGVKIYGGFRINANDEQDTAISVRGNSLGNITPTILSGDIGQVGNMNDNSYHVVVGTKITGNQTVVLDGFKIINGKANGSGSVNYRDQAIARNNGGGICIINGSSSGNIYNKFQNVIVENNIASENGGGIYNGGNCSAKFRNVIVRGNSSNNGGGIYNKSVSDFSQVVVSGNLATINGGGIYNENCNPQFINVTIGGNKAGTNGGGLYNTSANPNFKNSVIGSNNTSVYNSSSNPSFSYCLIQGSGGSSNWNSSYGTNSGNNKDAEPKFINYIDPNTDNFAATTSGEFRLKGSSQGIDAGSNTLYQTYMGVLNLNNEIDIFGTERVSHNAIDMGAYESIVFEVHFSGINVSIPNQLVALNDHIELPEEPTRAGYYFGGWFTDYGTYNIQWDFPNDVVIQDTTLYAKWTQIITYTVTFAGETININPQYVEQGHLAEEPNEPYRPDYTFGGWFTDNGTFNNQWNFNVNTVNSDITLYAKWNQILNTVSFVGINVNIPDQVVQYGQLVAEPTEPTRQYFTFEGWFTDNGTFTNEWDFQYNFVTSDTILYAKWEPIMFNVSFTGANVSVPSQQVQQGSLAIIPQDPTRLNYEFAGWFTDDGIFLNRWYFSSSIVMFDTVLYAKWVYDTIIYRVTFTGENIITDPEYVAPNSLVNIPAVPIRQGYIFEGWYKDDITFNNEWNFTQDLIISDTTLYAKWEAQIFTVSFAGVEIIIPSQQLPAGSLVVEPQEPERNNFIFGGWYTDNSTFTNEWDFDNYTIFSDTTLYAKWTPIVGLTENENKIITVYPNPSYDFIYIKGIENNTSAEISDISGRIIKKLNTSDTQPINIENLAVGVYFIKINEIQLKFVKK